ncbi:MAG TPA: hypothetical protein PLX89_05525 [Verrucomicrobiota bacterium]|nr:hypothetical protein [Verrucomicrobiales bacterium]HRI12447.1 hypothetical protein [Verrucomicrobiota bacterium]
MTRFGPSGRQKLTIAQQLLSLRADYPTGWGETCDGKLVWRQSLQPTVLSRKFQIRLVYRLTGSPSTFVEYPSLAELAQGRNIPHLYEQESARLCLYQPKYQEWTTDRLLSRTIVPWASLWLLYFEDWLISDEWKGGGEHPVTAKSAS